MPAFLPYNPDQRLSDSLSNHLEPVLESLMAMDRFVQQNAQAQQAQLADQPGIAKTPGPKFPAIPFNYLEALSDISDEPLTDDDVLKETARFFRGAIRPESDHSLFNMVPKPTPQATAAACLVNHYNVNSLMDAFGGESLLVEQQVVRTIGSWAGWHEAMGIACNGGKLTLFYGIKSAISRVAPEAIRSGVPDDLVILCSEGAHYCVEHAASLAGLGSANCWRVASDHTGQMQPEVLKQQLAKAHNNGKRVAAVVCCGGTTINFNCEDTAAVNTIVNGFVSDYQLNYRPYLHFDSVIGWLYFSLLNLSPEALAKKIPHPRTRQRLTEVLRRFAGLEGFDSFGVDFHKNGLCPYASSFFVSKDRRFMDELGDGSYQYSDRDFQFGQFRAYRYTIENSRPAQGILSSWINLKTLGRAGLTDYLLALYQAREGLCQAFQRQSRFKVINDDCLGWEVVFEMPFAEDIVAGADSRQSVAMAFISDCWQLTTAGYDTPLFSIVPDYRINNHPDQLTTAFLLYPMKPLSDHQWDSILATISQQLDTFEARLRQQPGQHLRSDIDKPIR